MYCYKIPAYEIMSVIERAARQRSVRTETPTGGQTPANEKAIILTRPDRKGAQLTLGVFKPDASPSARGALEVVRFDPALKVTSTVPTEVGGTFSELCTHEGPTCDWKCEYDEPGKVTRQRPTIVADTGLQIVDVISFQTGKGGADRKASGQTTYGLNRCC